MAAAPTPAAPTGEKASSCYLTTEWSECPLVGVLPYTPISSSSMKGKFQLLIKVYPATKEHPPGLLSNHIDGLKVGETAWFKHIKFNIKEQYPFRKKKLTMLCGGT